jgi:RNA polymerase sigma factor (sigma-70 family)
VAQNVFLIAWKKMPEFEYDISKGNFRGWLCRITGNEVKYFLRKKRKSVGTIDHEYNENTWNRLDEFTLPEIEAIAEKEWQSHICRIAWDNIEGKLPARVKAAYLLYLEGKNTTETAAQLQIKENTVYSYLKQARDKIKSEVRQLNHVLLTNR